MGLCAEKTANDFQITREENDNFAHQSYKKAIEANKNGKISFEIVPIKLKNGKIVKINNFIIKYKKIIFYFKFSGHLR